MEAPVEYHGLGNRLSKKRRLEAEEGHTHSTARQLGALFADDIPLVPNLSRVYGLRASEISANSTINPTGGASDGPLASHIGLDGTSIWAAATSGRGALQVHLLACILARVWSGAEAVSIWSELCAARRALLEERLKDDQFHIGHVMASRIEIGLEKLAEWDASARAWLSAADKAKYLQQKQLMLIIDNIDLQIRSTPRLYDAVLDVWTKALTTMEYLASGVAQNIDSPKVLLGLTSWHLYPDLAVLGDETKHIIQKDELIPKGGLVTIGMKGSQSRHESGITWTMPLAQMKFYGDPVHSSRSIGTKSLRISFDYIVHIAMGSAISDWSNLGSNLEEICQFWIKVAARCKAEAILEKTDLGSFSWLQLFSSQAGLFLRAKEQEKKDVTRLINLGRGRYRTFLAAPKQHPPPALGLGNASSYLSILGVEQQIEALRHLAQNYNLGFNIEGAVIFYMPEKSHHGEFATLVPQEVGQPQASVRLHRRWITSIRTAEGGVTTANNAVLDTMYPVPSRLRIDKEATILRTVNIMNSTYEPCGIIPTGTVTGDDGRDVEDH